jgi:HIRAN domain-containing protein
MWRRRNRQPQLRTLPLPGDGRCKVHGEASYQPTLHAACGGRVAPCTDEEDCWDRALQVAVALRPEPSNPYDGNAVRVDVLDFGCVGYLPRGDAVKFQPILLDIESRGYMGICEGRIVRNLDAGYYAIYLHLATPQMAGTLARAFAK